MSYIKKFKNKLSKNIENDMTRMRSKPRIYDYCYISTSNNLATLKKGLDYAKKDNLKLKILDIGCGKKPFLNMFDKQDNYLGIDFSKNSSADIIQDLNSKLPFDNEYFDFIIISETIEHLPDPLKVLNEATRVLKEKGIIFISSPFCLNIHGRPYDYYRYTEYFYKDYLTSKLPLICKTLKTSNSIITSPLCLIPHIFLVIPFFPNSAKLILNILINLFVIFLEKLLTPLRKNKYTNSFLNSLPIGYAGIFEKNNI